MSKSLIVDTSEIDRMAKAFGTTETMVRDEMRLGMTRAGEVVRAAAITNIKHKSGDLAKSGKVEVTTGGKTIELRVRFTAKHAGIVHNGRGAVVAKRAKALRFVIGGEVIFRKRVGPAAGTFYLKKGYESSRGNVDRIMVAAADRIARNVERLV